MPHEQGGIQPSRVEEALSPSESLRLEEFENEPSEPFATEISLPMPLQILFSLNGATLSLPSTALMFIVNTRVAIPISYLSVYGALAFLPVSFKPLYAYLTDLFHQRDKLLGILLIISGASIASTALIPKGGIAACFIVAFLRGFFSAWPELILGITMLEEAQTIATSNEASGCRATTTNSIMGIETKFSSNYDTIAARFQSQAATARNIGSWGATLVGFGFFLYRHYHVNNATEHELNDVVVNLILVMTGLINVFGAIFAWYHHVGSRHSYARLTRPVVPNTIDDTAFTPTISKSTNDSKMLYGEVILILLLQILVVIFAMRSPLVSATSSLVWNVTLVVLMLAMIVTVQRNYEKWSRRHSVGFFLIVRHAIPSSGMLMGSFVYELLQSAPMALQLLGVFSSAITTLSSWSFGRILAPLSSGKTFIAVIIGATILSSMVSLLDIIVVGLDKNDNKWKVLLTIITTSAFSTFAGEWSFLPSVVLATKAVSFDEKEQCTSSNIDNDDEHLEAPASYQKMRVSCCERQAPSSSVGMQYGALISCLDFGDQIGSWLTLPLVAALGISRENDWERMDTLIVVTSLLSLLPLALLPIIRD